MVVAVVVAVAAAVAAVVVYLPVCVTYSCPPPPPPPRSRLVSSMPYLKGDAPSRLDTYVPRLMRTYIQSRLDSVRIVAEGGAGESACAGIGGGKLSHLPWLSLFPIGMRQRALCPTATPPPPFRAHTHTHTHTHTPAVEDPLEQEDQLADQLDSLPLLCRFQYADTAEFITGLMDPLLAAFQVSLSLSRFNCLVIQPLSWSVNHLSRSVSQSVSQSAQQISVIVSCCVTSQAAQPLCF